MREGIRKNYLYNLAYQLVSIAVPVVTIPYVSRVLGPAGIGTFNFVNSIVAYFGIFAMNGTSIFGQREVARRQTDFCSRSEKFWEVFFARLASSVVALACYLLLLRIFHVPYTTLFLINLLTFASWILDVSWYFQGLEDFKTVANRNIITKTIGAALVFVAVRTQDDLWLYMLIYCVSSVLGSLSMWIRLKGVLSWRRIHFAQVLSNVGGIFALFLPVVAVQLYLTLNVTMLGVLASIADVGYYSQSSRVIQLLQTIVGSVTAVLLPRFVALNNQGDHSKLQRSYRMAAHFVSLVSIPMMFGTLAVAPVFVPAFFGGGYQPVIGLLCVQSLLLPVVSLGQLLGTVLISTDRQGAYTVAVCVTAICNFLLNLFLIRGLGAMGAAISIVVSELVATGLQLLFVRTMLDLRAVWMLLFRYSFGGVLMLLAIRLFFLTGWDGPAGLIFYSMIGVGFYVGYLKVTGDELYVSHLAPMWRMVIWWRR